LNLSKDSDDYGELIESSLLQFTQRLGKSGIFITADDTASTAPTETKQEESKIEAKPVQVVLPKITKVPKLNNNQELIAFL
jgi:hypothetical protein